MSKQPEPYKSSSSSPPVEWAVVLLPQIKRQGFTSVFVHALREDPEAVITAVRSLGYVVARKAGAVLIRIPQPPARYFTVRNLPRNWKSEAA